MRVYDVEGFPNPARIRIALAEKGAIADVEFVAVDVMNGEHRSADYVSKNPDASVPLLELEDGTYLSQCTAITEYIDGSYPGDRLCGQTPKERAIIHMMNRRAENGLLDAVGDYFHHATPGLGPTLETNQVADWGNLRKSKAIETMRYLDQVLENHAYVAGDTFSMADITVFTGLAFADFAKIEIPSEFTNLLAWREKVAARPSIAA